VCQEPGQSGKVLKARAAALCSLGVIFQVSRRDSWLSFNNSRLEVVKACKAWQISVCCAWLTDETPQTQAPCCLL
jgi:hypothetical protein